jgi:hypothetical protein
MNLNLNVEQFDYFCFQFNTTKLSKLWKKQRSLTQKPKGLMGLKITYTHRSASKENYMLWKEKEFLQGTRRLLFGTDSSVLGKYACFALAYIHNMYEYFVLIWEGLHYSLRRKIQF